MPVRFAPRHILLLFAAIAVLWAVAVALSGGFVLDMSWVRLSSRDPVRPLLLALAAVAAYASIVPGEARAAARWLSGLRWPPLIGGAAALTVLAIGVRYGTFVASSADPSGYVSQASLWSSGRLLAPVPEWLPAAPWPDRLWTVSPLGYRPAPHDWALVPTYPPGLPMLMAVLEMFAGPSGAFFVVPLLGAAMAWATWRLGATLTGDEWVGAAASVMLVASPAFLFTLLQPMSDVPCAAFWTLALAWALRPGARDALAAGLFTSAAVLTRPNLVPLALIAGAVVMASSARENMWRRGVLFASAASLSVAAIAGLNWHWYGSPLQSGYGSLDELYDLQQWRPNLDRYSRWLRETQTPLVALFLAAPFLIRAGRRLAVWLVVPGFPLAVLAMYLLYNPFEEWWYLRFILPAFPAVFAGCTATAVIGARRWLPRRAAAITAAVLLVTMIAWTAAVVRERGVLSMGVAEQRYLRMAEYTAHLPPRSVFAAIIHSGSLRFYTGRDVLRWDAIERSRIEEALAFLRARGHDVYLVAERNEVGPFRERFDGTRVASDLDVEPTIVAGDVVVYALAGSRPLPPAR